MKRGTRCFIHCFIVYAGIFFLELIIGINAAQGFLLKSQAALDDFNEMSFEELMDIEVVTASKKPEKLSETAAAMFVITQEDIRRSGVSTIPDALRLAPGVHVARINTHWWSISIRGLNEGLYSNKLLVLIDGRSVYNPIYSGVFWDVQDTLLEDIERIEVIRGPGSAVWGANAVNGVINIITKHADRTTGWFFSTEYKNLIDVNLAGVRYGAKAGETAWYRIFAKYFRRDSMDESVKNMPHTENQPMTIYSEERRIDSWNGFRGGFRFDWEPSYRHNFSLQSEGYYNQDIMQTSIKNKQEELEETSHIGGIFLLGSWEYRFSGDSEAIVQCYYDFTSRDSQQAKYSIHALDLDLRYHFYFAAGKELSLGLGYRLIYDNLENFYLEQFDPDKMHQDLASAFFQGTTQFFDYKLRLIAGSKFEYNDYTGLEIQPSVRMVWTPKFHYSLWAAVSRAVRTPARTERSGTLLFNFDVPEYWENSNPKQQDLPDMITIDYREIPSRNFNSESVIALEGGLRLQPTDFIWADLSLFYHRYRDLKQLTDHYPQGQKPVLKEPPRPGEFPWETNDEKFISLHRYPINNIEGKSFGFEAVFDIKASQKWRIKPSYSWLNIDLKAKSYIDDIMEFRDIYTMENSSPQQMLSVRSEYTITNNIDFDLGLRYVDSIRLKNHDAAGSKINSYYVFDARLAWRPFKGFEAAIIGRDLWSSHAEISELKVCPSVIGKVTWKY